MRWNLWKADFAQFDADMRALRGEMRRNGRRKSIGFRQSATARDSGQTDYGCAIGAIASAGLDWLPVDSVESRAEKCSDGCFADVGICSGDEKTTAIVSHSPLCMVYDGPQGLKPL